MLKFLPFLVVAAVLVGLFNYTPFKREVAYKLGISGDTTQSCCDVNTLSKTGEFDESASMAFFNNDMVRIFTKSNIIII